MATAAQIREHYDSLTLIYRTFWGDHLHHGLFETGAESPEAAQVKMLDHCIQGLDLRGGEQVLDAGCGHGGTLLYLAEKLNCEGLGLTLSPKQARIAQEKASRGGRKLTFLVEDVEHFKFPSDQVDLVWAMESTEHFADKKKFFRNVNAALREDGQLLVAAWTGSMTSPRVREVARAFLCPELWTAEEYQAAIESAGMQVRFCEDLTAKVIRTWEICLQHARSAGPVVKLMPRAVREFIEGIEIILDAYRSGDLTYTVLTAAKANQV